VASDVREQENVGPLGDQFGNGEVAEVVKAPLRKPGSL
jgi:hypothetical protein